MTEEMKTLRDNTDRRFAILMTALQDFMVAYQQERNRNDALLNIEKKVEEKTVQKTAVIPKKRRVVKP